MWDVLLLFSSICTAVVVGAPVTVKGHRGERVMIKCSYEPGYESYSKYFCKGDCSFGNKNIMVKSGSKAKDKRFSLTDDKKKRVFTVTITDLRTEDAGQYWCAVERSLPLADLYSEILLKVNQDKKTTEVSTISPFSKTQSSFSTTDLNLQSVTQTESETARTENTTVELHQPTTNLASVAGGLGSVLLVLTLCSGTFLILKKRKMKCGTALVQLNVQHNTETDVAAVTSSPNQTPASHLNTHPEVSTVYATVTKQQHDSNPSHTNSTNQVTDPDCDYYANVKSPDPTQDSRTELIYVTATHPQNISTHPQIISRNEGVIYSVINSK
ncbi:CMRF35-like molecule 3 isoform X2 [Chanodichthys erythropterus]|uniref:CMRF35-like molecule 3 isoform X2 n=1 Tax=Chanodichthys erythropterus TaxID=933992 RepID=UPI00351EC2BD